MLVSILAPFFSLMCNTLYVLSISYILQQTCIKLLLHYYALIVVVFPPKHKDYHVLDLELINQWSSSCLLAFKLDCILTKAYHVNWSLPNIKASIVSATFFVRHLVSNPTTPENRRKPDSNSLNRPVLRRKYKNRCWTVSSNHYEPNHTKPGREGGGRARFGLGSGTSESSWATRCGPLSAQDLLESRMVCFEFDLFLQYIYFINHLGCGWVQFPLNEHALFRYLFLIIYFWDHWLDQ
jgi:hypothetical protein